MATILSITTKNGGDMSEFHFPVSQHSQRPIRILQISDPHLLQDKHGIFAGIQPFASLQAVLEHAQKEQLPFDCVLCTGDIAQEPTIQTYQHYLNAVQTLEIPHFWIRGNHDDNADFPEPSEDHQPKVIVVGQWRIIMLNSQKHGCIHGEISSEQLCFLRDYLQRYPDDFFIIALHHNTFPVGCAWLDPHRLQNADALLDCLYPHPQVKIVLSGHVHQVFEYQHTQVHFLSCPSTCVQFKPLQDQFRLDVLAPGYRILELHADGRHDTDIFRLAANLGEIDMQLSEY